MKMQWKITVVAGVSFLFIAGCLAIFGQDQETNRGVHVVVPDDVMATGGAVVFLARKSDDPTVNRLKSRVVIEEPYSVIVFDYFDTSGDDYVIRFEAEHPGKSDGTYTPQTKKVSSGSSVVTVNGNQRKETTAIIVAIFPVSLRAEASQSAGAENKYVSSATKLSTNSGMIIDTGENCNSREDGVTLCSVQSLEGLPF